jgi:membrane-associated protease RseP (regulator of RpoE activity)
MNDGSTMKGIVVEDYKDRVVLSTEYGEKTVMKSDIGELYYDNEEENLIKLAEQARERRDYARAFGYYNLAYKKNPLSRAAKDGFVFLQGYLFRQEEKRKMDEIKKRGDFEQGLVAEDAARAGTMGAKDPAARMKEAIGITLVSKDGSILVDSVRKNSPADDAGIEQGDYLVAIWGRLVGYMSLDDVINILLDKPSLEIKCTVRRTILADTSRAVFGMDIDGLKAVSIKNGDGGTGGYLKEDDLVTAIGGRPTRYMPFKKAMAAMKRSKTVELTIDRELLIWRKD